MSQVKTLQQGEPTRAPLKPQPGTTEPGKTPGPSKTEVPAKPGVPEAGKTGPEPGSDTGILALSVPASAKVFINGHETRSQGTRRQYVSSGLVPGKVYPYAVTVMVPAAQTGAAPQWETRAKTVYLKAGERLSLNFDRQANPVLMAGGQ